MNDVKLTGRLTRDPELKWMTSGKVVTNFSVALNRPARAGAKEETDFFDCEAWEQTAEFIDKYFSKGSPILLSGRLKQDRWETDGQKRSKVLVVVSRAEFFSTNREDRTENTNAETAVEDTETEEVPF